MRIYNVHYGMNGEEHDYVIEAMSESDALTAVGAKTLRERKEKAHTLNSGLTIYPIARKTEIFVEE